MFHVKSFVKIGLFLRKLEIWRCNHFTYGITAAILDVESKKWGKKHLLVFLWATHWLRLVHITLIFREAQTEYDGRTDRRTQGNSNSSPGLLPVELKRGNKYRRPLRWNIEESRKWSSHNLTIFGTPWYFTLIQPPNIRIHKCYSYHTPMIAPIIPLKLSALQKR